MRSPGQGVRQGVLLRAGRSFALSFLRFFVLSRMPKRSPRPQKVSGRKRRKRRRAKIRITRMPNEREFQVEQRTSSSHRKIIKILETNFSSPFRNLNEFLDGDFLPSVANQTYRWPSSTEDSEFQRGPSISLGGHSLRARPNSSFATDLAVVVGVSLPAGH